MKRFTFSTFHIFFIFLLARILFIRMMPLADWITIIVSVMPNFVSGYMNMNMNICGTLNGQYMLGPPWTENERKEVSKCGQEIAYIRFRYIHIYFTMHILWWIASGYVCVCQCFFSRVVSDCTVDGTCHFSRFFFF